MGRVPLRDPQTGRLFAWVASAERRGQGPAYGCMSNALSCTDHNRGEASIEEMVAAGEKRVTLIIGPQISLEGGVLPNEVRREHRIVLSGNDR